MKTLGKFFARTFAILITAYLLPGVHIDSFFTTIIVAIVLSLLNTFIKPLLIILTIPATILTFGLFLIVVNVLIILMADSLVDGFQVDGFWWAVLFSFVLSFVSSIFDPPKKKRNDFDD